MLDDITKLHPTYCIGKLYKTGWFRCNFRFFVGLTNSPSQTHRSVRRAWAETIHWKTEIPKHTIHNSTVNRNSGTWATKLYKRFTAPHQTSVDSTIIYWWGKTYFSNLLCPTSSVPVSNKEPFAWRKTSSVSQTSSCDIINSIRPTWTDTNTIKTHQ